MAFDLNEAIREVIALTRSQVHQNGAAILLDLAEGLPWVLGDRVQLQQVVLGLIVNASEATRGQGDGPHDIVVWTRMSGADALSVEVQDRGLASALARRRGSSVRST